MMVNAGQPYNKSMLTVAQEKSTKGAANILYHSPTDREIFSTPKILPSIPDSEMHDEDLYTYKNLAAAKFENSREVTHV